MAYSEETERNGQKIWKKAQVAIFAEVRRRPWFRCHSRQTM